MNEVDKKTLKALRDELMKEIAECADQIAAIDRQLKQN
jgi:vacuolar-type H+-ATPase subunit D/Vma8